MTPLECATAHGHVDAITLLVGAGARPGRAFKVAAEHDQMDALLDGITLAAEGGFLRPQRTFDPGKAPPLRPPSPQQRHAPTTAKGAGDGGSVGRAAPGGGAAERAKGSKQGEAPTAALERPWVLPPMAKVALSLLTTYFVPRLLQGAWRRWWRSRG